jgi:uncharacterized RDD family membrane protein YckC
MSQTPPFDPGQGNPPPPGGMPPPPPPGAYGAPTGQPAGGAWSGPPLADFGKRAIGALIDYFVPGIAVVILAIIFGAISSTLGVLIYFLGGIAALAWAIYNKVQEGNTGQSLGKKQAGTKLVGETTLQPIGAGNAIIRYLVHFVDSIICYIGWLFPLWDPKRQTIADKIMKTVVIEA